MYRILIVEDDEIIARSLKKHLESWDYDVVCVEDFSDVMKEFVGAAPQLVLMDIKLPFYNGYHWCSRIREVSKVPVIFVSSASDNMNIVMAVNMGGDDFIAKPFDLDVLIAKIQALLRRTYDFAGQNTVLEHRGALLNLGDATLICGETGSSKHRGGVATGRYLWMRIPFPSTWEGCGKSWMQQDFRILF